MVVTFWLTGLIFAGIGALYRGVAMMGKYFQQDWFQGKNIVVLGLARSGLGRVQAAGAKSNG